MYDHSRIIPFPIPDNYSVNLSLYPINAENHEPEEPKREFSISQPDRALLKGIMERYDRNKYEELKNQVYNLTRYLSHIESNDYITFKHLRAHFDGLPGYTPAILEGDDSHA